LWGVINISAVPPIPDTILLSQFEAHFSDKTTENDLHQIADRYSLIQPDLIKIGTNISIATSKKITSEVKAVKEFILKFVQVSISKFGLIQ